MRLAVVGSRDFAATDRVVSFLDFILKQRPDLSIVSGGADGPDKIAEEWAKARDIACQVFPADWEKDGNKAGPKRNGLIIENSDAMIAFWDGESAGTLDSITRGSKKKDYNIRVYIA